MADIPRGNRPLSPHLQVYRLPLAAVTSIMTRATGQGMIPGLLLLTWWLVAAVTSPEAFAAADAVLRSWFGALVMLAAVWSLWFHFFAGLRHLYYDAGYGMEIATSRNLSIGVVAGSVILTILTLVIYI